MRIRSVATPTLAALAIALATPAVQAAPATARPDGWHGGWGWGWGHMVFGSLMMLLFWGAVVLAVIFAARWLGTSHQRPESPPSTRQPLAILEERLARGEIDQAEFEERKRLLSN